MPFSALLFAAVSACGATVGSACVCCGCCCRRVARRLVWRAGVVCRRYAGCGCPLCGVAATEVSPRRPARLLCACLVQRLVCWPFRLRGVALPACPFIRSRRRLLAWLVASRLLVCLFLRALLRRRSPACSPRGCWLVCTIVQRKKRGFSSAARWSQRLVSSCLRLRRRVALSVRLLAR